MDINRFQGLETHKKTLENHNKILDELEEIFDKNNLRTKSFKPSRETYHYQFYKR